MFTHCRLSASAAVRTIGDDRDNRHVCAVSCDGWGTVGMESSEQVTQFTFACVPWNRSVVSHDGSYPAFADAYRLADTNRFCSSSTNHQNAAVYTERILAGGWPSLCG